ncbi:MAG: excinuclease ABC subunit UvrC [Candidatus Nanoarchaeia archaeon]|nr:excinuclease ABC subunit UvrC [Candidatus Nanoarchaeia archaeon]
MFDIKKYKIPVNPGCYLFKSNEEIIYIGKAKNLKNRVNSYFNNKNITNSSNYIKTNLMLDSATSIEFIVCNNEIEAFILENNLIKKHLPKYNILLKDSKTYPYVLITDEKFPRVISVRNKKMKGEYFGPFPNATFKNSFIEMINNKFKLRTCKTLPKKPCLRYQIGLCDAPCINNDVDYNSKIEKVKELLKGNGEDLKKKLNEEMKEYSQKLEFEKSMKIREQILAIDYISSSQLIERDKRNQEDVINYLIDKEKVKIVVFYVRDGILNGKNEYTIDYIEDFFDEFVKTFYSQNEIPKKIIIPHELSDDSIYEYLNHLANRKVEFIIPKRGDKKNLLELAKNNIEIKYKESELQKNDLYEMLKLNISTIECFDISHIQGSDMVASMVHFKDGQPIKSNYRRFKIRSVVGIDDFRAIYEVVYRRYKKAKVPDLIVIDGGKIQLDFAKKALKELNIDANIIGLAKRLEEIYRDDDVFNFENSRIGMRLLIRIRDETHRFGITYHRLRRKKRYFDDK